MSLPAATVWEVRNGGSDTNGGGFVRGGSGTDWSQQTSPQYSVTDGVLVGTTTVTSATAAFGTDVVDNIANVDGAWYRIVSRTNSTTIVVDRNTGSGTGKTIKIGGAFASPGMAGSVMVAENWLYIKYNASAFVLSSASNNVAGGTLTPPSGNQDDGGDHFTYIIGYDTTRSRDNRDANRPTVQVPGAGVTSVNVINTVNVSNCVLANLIVDGNSKTGIVGFYCGNVAQVIYRCDALNCPTQGFNSAGGSSHMMFKECYASGSGTGFYGLGAICVECVCQSGAGFDIEGGALIRCIADSCSDFGFKINDFTIVDHCVSVNNTNDGFVAEYFNSGGECFNACIAYGNGGYGWQTRAGFNMGYGVSLFNCAGGSNTSGNIRGSTTAMNIGFVTLTADPFTNRSGHDFSLNTAAGGGAALRGLTL